ncbi:transmembrane channel-like protein 1 [Babylonia areolata]|uniref:transmembrane channel-like protein 1 n=1 Tax=Babylonia areolata TaxID=304850 RepID=UPI003FD0E412
MSHQWSRRNSHRASSRRKRRRRSVRSNSSFGGFPEDEDEILQMYGEDGELDEDPAILVNPEALVDRIRDQKEMMENVKFQPWPIGKKLRLLSLARSFIEKHEGRLSRGRGYQQKGQQLLKQLKRSWNNLENWITPWEMKIKRIESHFGSVVTSYFIFLRWLLWINLWLTVGQCCFVIVPETLVGQDYGATMRKTIPENEEHTAYDLKTIWNAAGVMRYSPLFYGYYGNEPTIGSGYRLPLAYLVTTLVSFAYSFIVVLKKMASNSRQSRMSNKDEQFTFAWKLFSDWDYMVGNPETATTKHASIVTTMKEAIVEEQEKKQEENKYLLIFLRVLANVLIVILLAASTYVIYLFVERSRELELKKLANPDYQADFWSENELTIIVTMITTLFPNVLDLISLMEKYHPRTALRLMLARIFVLNLINLYTLFIALYYKQEDLQNATFQAGEITNSSQCSNSSSTSNLLLDLPSTTPLPSPSPIITQMAPVTSSPGTAQSNSSHLLADCDSHLNATRANICWETMIGQEVFKLTIMDLIVTLGQIFVIDVFRSIFVKYCNNICCWDLQKTFPEYPDFKTAENLLHLINNQGVIWLGVFFSPGLALLNLMKLLLLMYVRCWTVLVCNVPQERIFRASRSNNFYFALLLVMLFLCMLPPLFAIVGIKPSVSCGPFSDLEKIYHILTRTMETELPSSVNSLIEYAASPGVILPIFMLMGMTIYYLISVGRSLRDANNELRMMLEYERTEGRKKVYAMADAKHEEPPGGVQNPGLAKMASAVSSVLKAARSAKAFGGLGLAVEQKRKQPSTSDAGGEKGAPAVHPKPHVPVAVVHGKRSLKRSAAAVRNRAVALRQQNQQQQRDQHQQQYRQHPPDRQRVAATNGRTNGRMQVTASSSLDTPEASSNEEEEEEDVEGLSSPHSSPNSSSHVSPHHQHRHHDDPSATVDQTGHLRPVTEDDVELEMGSSSDDDDEDQSDDDGARDEPGDDTANLPTSSGTPEHTSSTQRQSAARPPAVRPKPSRPSRKIQPTEIPTITVVDFGEEASANEHQSGDDSPETHVEPMVIVENEETSHRKRPRRNKVVSTESQQSERTKQKARKSARTSQQSVPSERNDEIRNDPGESAVTVEPSVNDNDEHRTSENRPSTSHGNGDATDGARNSEAAVKKTQGKAKARFSSILARFQKMEK